MTIPEMKERKKQLGYTNTQLSILSGIPIREVQDVFSDPPGNYTYETLDALETVLDPHEDSCIRETAHAYLTKPQGSYTLEDYYRIPDDYRVELIDGVIYDMGAPTSAHQLIAGILYARFYNHVHEQNGTCLPMISPLDVQLDCDEKTMIQPDVIVVCDRNKVINRCVYGAPDLVIEVLSPSSRYRDAVIKPGKYQQAGVREYWLIDPIRRNVSVYDFAHDNYPAIYGFDSRIPVSIWEDGFEIDFQEVYDEIRFLYERE